MMVRLLLCTLALPKDKFEDDPPPLLSSIGRCARRLNHRNTLRSETPWPSSHMSCSALSEVGGTPSCRRIRRHHRFGDHARISASLGVKSSRRQSRIELGVLGQRRQGRGRQDGGRGQSRGGKSIQAGRVVRFACGQIDLIGADTGNAAEAGVAVSAVLNQRER